MDNTYITVICHQLYAGRLIADVALPSIVQLKDIALSPHRYIFGLDMSDSNQCTLRSFDDICMRIYTVYVSGLTSGFQWYVFYLFLIIISYLVILFSFIPYLLYSCLWFNDTHYLLVGFGFLFCSRFSLMKQIHFCKRLEQSIQVVTSHFSFL